MPEIRQKADVDRGSAQQKPDGILGIVRHHERLDHNISDLKTGAGRENSAIQLGFELIFQGILRWAVAVDRNFEFFTQLQKALDVV